MDRPPRIGILWRGRAGDPVPSRETIRLRAIFDEFEAQGAHAQPVIFCEEAADDVRDTIAGLDAVLVWVDPIVAGRDRLVLDAILREAVITGTYVSAHPDVILKMGTKDVLVRTRDMAWGSDTHRIDSVEGLGQELLARLRSGSRVLKQHRGSSGDGVWKVELIREALLPEESELEIRHAARGGRREQVTLGDLSQRFEPYFAAFAGTGCMLDQPYQERVADGMVRAYLSVDKVVGFGHQYVTALAPLEEGVDETPAPPARIYFGPDRAEFQPLRAKLEGGWVAEMQGICGVEKAELPVVWDADFLLGPKTPSGEDSYVLCEINVSGVFPIPDEAVAPLVTTTLESLSR